MKRTILYMCIGLLSPAAASAWFESVEFGARGLAIGRAYTALAEDATAVYWNPANLVTMSHTEVAVEYARPYVIDGYSVGAVAAATHRGRTSFGVAWRHAGVDGVIGEDMLHLAVARDLLEYGGDWAWSAGLTAKLASVGYDGDLRVDYGRESAVSFDLSTLVNVGGKWTFGGIVRNITEPEIEFVDGGGGTELARTFDVGVGYRWHQDSLLAASITRDAWEEVAVHFGGEIWFYQVFGLRSGISEGEYVGGVGLKASRYHIDLAVLTDTELGVSYQIGLRVPFGEARW